MDTAETDSLLGTRVFGGYQITKRIGAGGMGAVYLAENRSLGRKLAVKVLLTERSHSSHAVARFLAEAKAASALQHRNIIDVLDTALLPDGRHYILMEYLEGSTLRHFARANYPLTLELVLAVMGQVCAGLQVAHDRGIIHRDLKPSNIFVSPQPDNPYLTKILDFGIAKLAAPDLTSDAHTKSRTVAGTPHYMSPEQARALRDVDHRTDLYAVGVIAYELITGRPPYIANSAGDLVYQQQTQAVTPPMQVCPGLTEGWNQLILDTVSLDANKRPQSARELAMRMVEATERGTQIARATAPMLFPSAVSEPLTGERSQPVASWSDSSIPMVISKSREQSGPARPPVTELPPARPPATAMSPSERAPSSLPLQPSQFSDSSLPPNDPDGLGGPTERSVPNFPMPTRDLRGTGGTGSQQQLESGVPTTLGLSASEMPVFEGTAVDGKVRGGRRSWTVVLMTVLGLSVIGAAAFLVLDMRDGTSSGTQPEPTAVPLESRDAGQPVDAAAAAAAVVQTPADAAPQVSVDAAEEVEVATDPDSDPPRGERTRPRQPRAKKVDAGVKKPKSDDELFDTRE